MPTYKKCMW